ncbi:MAG: VWA domain-containing protein [Candidatus Hydrogenedentes bacterium]|nr:VWA domain-containing protein [Candidatus Hydrogenedentota bacterium]
MDEQLSRNAVLAGSVALSLLVHVGLLAASPSVSFLGRGMPEGLRPDTMRVRLLDESELMHLDAAPGAPGTGLATRPGSVIDLLQDALAPIDQTDTALSQTIDVPNLDQRVAQDKLASLEPAIPTDVIQRQLDAKIIEISEDAARRDVQVERRLVAPSSTRILPEDAHPVIRGLSGLATDDALMIDPLALGGGSAKPGAESGPGDQPMDEPDPLKPSRESPLADLSEDVLRALPELPMEKVVARAPVVNEIVRNKRFDFMDDTVTMQLETFVPANEREGYFRLQIVPKEGESLPILPKDVTFAIDASSSIIQRKLDQAARGVQRSIQNLREDDRFNVVVFRDTPTLFQPDLIPATAQNKNAAAQFLKGLESRGKTDVYEGIRPVINQTPRAGVPGIVFVVSDGKPTTGILDGRTLINSLTDQNNSKYSIYAFSGGNTVNQHLLDLLAYRNKGECDVVPQIDDMNRKLPDFFSRLSDPILVDCAADYGRINDAGVFPRQIPDFYKGQVVTVYGRFDPKRDREFAMRLTGLAGDRKKEVVFKADLTKAAKGNENIARNWAFRKIYHLIGEATRTGETPELLGQIRGLAQQYGIRTSYD